MCDESSISIEEIEEQQLASILAQSKIMNG